MVRRGFAQDLDALTQLAIKLWPENGYEETKEDLNGFLQMEDAAFFVAYEETLPIGFAQCQLRRDYVEGTDSSPVGYLEGIYVEEDFREKGVAKELLNACEAWAKEKGCTEFASDCQLENVTSLRFHLNVGFREANRIICFVKSLK